MMGNFMPAERAPVLEIGGHAFRIPAQLTWQQDQNQPLLLRTALQW